MESLPKLSQTKKHDILELWNADLCNYTGELYCNLPGFEFLLPPYPISAVRFDNQTLRPSRQSVLLFNGSEGHTERFVESTGPLKSLIINHKFVTDLCAPAGLDARDIIFKDIELQRDERLQSALSNLAGAAQLADSSELLIDCMTTELMMRLLTVHKHSKQGALLKESDFARFPGIIPRIKAVFLEHLQDAEFSLDLLAKQAGLSKFHLIRVFKKETGVSPAKYMSHLKIEMAKISLRKTKKTILSIALDLGFRDLSTFNKAFKKSTGLSPREFRAA